jgi:hypothetical protein
MEWSIVLFLNGQMYFKFVIHHLGIYYLLLNLLTTFLQYGENVETDTTNICILGTPSNSMMQKLTFSNYYVFLEYGWVHVRDPG